LRSPKPIRVAELKTLRAASLTLTCTVQTDAVVVAVGIALLGTVLCCTGGRRQGFR